MLLSLLPLAGWAQFSVNNYVQKGNFIYKITQAAVGEDPGRVVLYGIRDGYNPVDENKALNLEGKITIAIVDGPSFDFIVDYANTDALKNTYAFTTFDADPTLVGAFAGMVNAESVVIPKEFLTIKANQFYGYTNMKSISFQEGSQVETIESGAFNTTQIETFDFRYCSKLTAIAEGLFVEAGDAINSYVKTITLPEASEALVTIGTAFQRLPNLSAINNLDKSKITTVEALAFKGDTSLEILALPNTVQTIAATAFQGSGIANLTIDVTSLDDATAGNVYGTSTAVLETLTLKGVLAGVFKPQAFKGCTGLTTITMTDMTINGGTIGANAFENCINLTALTFNDITEGTIGNSAFKGCTKLASVTFGAITGTELVDALIDQSAFENCTKLGVITFGNLEHVTIDQNAFKACASGAVAASPAPALTFGTLTDVDINASAFEGCTKLTAITFGAADGLNIASKAFASCTSAATSATLTFSTLKDVVISGTVTTTGAFYNTTKLASIQFGAADNLAIQAFAFENATSGLNGTNYASATFGNLENNSSIADNAFTGATRLNSVTIGDVTNSTIGQSTAAVFPSLQTASIGAVKTTTDVTLIGTGAFTFANYSGATLSLSDGKSLETLPAATKALVAAGAFNFTAIDGNVGDPFVAPIATIGEIKTAKTMAAGALKGDNIAKITFNGNIAAGALDAMIVCDDNNVATDLALLDELVFNGEIAADGITANAFASLPAVMEITFNGKLAAAAVAVGAFEGLVANSQIIYTYNEEDLDLTINPFAKGAFKATAAVGDARIIKFAVTNTDLKAKYEGATGFTTDGAFDVYLAYFFVPAPEPDLSFLVYPDIVSNAKHTASPRTAWARWELGARVAEGVTGTLVANTNLVIKRVQKVDGTNNAKITVYGTYTDEDDDLNAATIYMMPLKAVNGYYHIPGTNKTTLIVKVENNGADFTENSYKVKVNQTGWDPYNENACTNVAGAKNGSIWPGLVNTQLYVANNIMTNQQLIDKQATDAASTDPSGVYGYYHAARTKTGDDTSIDIYRGGTAIAEDLYIMSDPSKNKGFRIDKNEISSTNNAYINAGWYYMLLKKYEGAAAAARVLWLDDATEGEITGILNVKHDAQNSNAQSNAIYTLQGIRVSQPQKGMIYIQNGKKFIAK